MMNKRIKVLKDRKRILIEEMKKLKDTCDAEDREPTEEEQEQWDTANKRCDKVEGQIAWEEKLIAREMAATSTSRRIFGDVDEVEARNQDEAASNDTFETFGEQLVAIVKAGMPAGEGYALDPRLRISAATGLSEGIPADGGFLVQTDFAAELLKKLHNTGQVWNRCRNIPISANSNGVKVNAISEASRADGSRWGGILAYWKAEAASKTASQPEFRQIELNLKKLIGLCYATDELLEDASALEAVIGDGFAEEFGFKLDDACINGLGAGQPLGILVSPCLVTVAIEAGQLAGTIVYENITKMWSRLWAPSQSNAVWFINQSVQPELFNMALIGGGNSTPAYMPPNGLASAPFATLMGRPVVPIEQCAALGTVGDIILADMSQYVTATKGGLQAASSIHLKFNYDETTFRFVYRADGQPLWNAALIPYKDATKTQSPFVVLAGRP